MQLKDHYAEDDGDIRTSGGSHDTSYSYHAGGFVQGARELEITNGWICWWAWPVYNLQKLRNMNHNGVGSDVVIAATRGVKCKRMMMNCKTKCRARISMNKKKKQVWVWTENQQVMTTAVERGWTTFLFSSPHLATNWSSIARINPLFLKDGDIYDVDDQIVVTVSLNSTPEELSQFQPTDEQPDNIIVNLLDWQAIPAENIVAAFQGTDKRVMAVSKTPEEAQMFLEVGLGGVVLKVEDVKTVLDMKEYFDRIDEVGTPLALTRATVSHVQMTGMGDRVCVDICSLMKPGEGLLVGSFARGLFLVHLECLDTSYISSMPFRVNVVSLLISHSILKAMLL
ncbi:3-dehydroquinate synthase, prokaryotic-type [Heracleum sosnowskyi]|uniref:3-dehydroquinate synthase, prokaryotic-type n=1 Tax=Heracleum sosnowskyi TaxID=360622 RepID=A0AAD8M511_9APIA|nr:3-dehydroquinate synthase, prokaryotic-type [Heracleum sosnowskyi]